MTQKLVRGSVRTEHLVKEGAASAQSSKQRLRIIARAQLSEQTLTLGNCAGALLADRDQAKSDPSDNQNHSGDQSILAGRSHAEFSDVLGGHDHSEVGGSRGNRRKNGGIHYPQAPYSMDNPERAHHCRRIMVTSHRYG